MKNKMARYVAHQAKHDSSMLKKERRLLTGIACLG